ncbi:MAG: NAD(+) diphosphatase [Rhodospirillales bacterium]
MNFAISYSGCPLDRAVHRRGDHAWIEERLRDGESHLVPIWREQILVAGNDRPRLAALAGAPAKQAHALADHVVFLGTGDGGNAWFACDLSRHQPEQLAPLLNGSAFRDLGTVVTRLSGGEGAVLAYARAMLHWHRRHRFCGSCGAPTEARNGGHLRACTDPACGSEHFPRTDPVVIMLVTRTDPETGAPCCLLGRQQRWMPGLVSALAGFVEPGETLEEAVRREVREEIGLSLDAVHYRTSQPWPFPGSLMLGSLAQAAPGEVVIDHEELEDARWFPRQDVMRIRTLGLRLPFRGTIARALIEEWLAETAGAR